MSLFEVWHPSIQTPGRLPRAHAPSFVGTPARPLVTARSTNARHAPTQVGEVLASRDRQRAPDPAPACGLTLESTYYDIGWDGAHAAPGNWLEK